MAKQTNGFAKMDESFMWHVKYFCYNSLFSRKFVVFAAVCGLVLGKVVDQDIWMFTAFAYMGANVLDKYVAAKEKAIK
jgi:hypothetical protein